MTSDVINLNDDVEVMTALVTGFARLSKVNRLLAVGYVRGMGAAMEYDEKESDCSHSQSGKEAKAAPKPKQP